MTDTAKTDLETVDAAVFGAGLRGIGLNLVVRGVKARAEMLVSVFGMTAHRVSDDFAIMRYGEAVFQLHADHTYHANALLGLLPEAGARGAGVELRLFDTDPDRASEQASDRDDMTVLAAPEDKPHGLREAVLLDADGYTWVPSRPL